MLFEPHPAFKLNGKSVSPEDLLEIGYSLIKEGEPFEQAIGDFLLDWSNADSFIQVKTSGSTGAPKCIVLEKRHIVNSAKATGEFFGLNPGHTALLCLPTHFIAGKMMWVRAMVLGLDLYYVEPDSRPLDRVSRTFDFSAMVPLQVQNSLSKLNRIRTLIVGGAPLHETLRKNIQDTDCQVFETYGMTETISHIALKGVNRPAEGHFRTLPNVVVSKDSRGCLVVNAPHIAERPVITNDLIHLISQTGFEWLGRYDHIINSGGVKLFPEKIESKLQRIIPDRFFVTGLPDGELGEKLVLIIEGEIDKEDLLMKIKTNSAIERYEVPKEIYTLPRFSETENGKIKRKETLLLILK